MSRNALQIQNLGKQYLIGQRANGYKTVREAVMNALKSPWKRLSDLSGRGDEKSYFWALRDVSFDVADGEAVGIIGHNGAGKSTLLKILSQITEPTTGEVRIHGRVGSLLEVGTGFHPELTGRENVFVNGAILGMSRQEVKRKFDEIVDFAGVEKFLDTPVKRYSSGMQVRLAFAVAAHLEPEILVVDEVLAVGDSEFQKKCMGKMGDVAKGGRTVLFVSHNLAAVESLCTRACLLKAGRMVAIGDTASIIARYVDAGCELSGDIDLAEHSGRPATRQAVFRRLRMLDSDGRESPTVRIGGDICFELKLESATPISARSVAIRVVDQRGLILFTSNSRQILNSSLKIAGRVTLGCSIRNIRLIPGRYQLQILLRNDGHQMLDELQSGIEFEVLPLQSNSMSKIPTAKSGMLVPEATWELLSETNGRPVHKELTIPSSR